MRVTVEIADSVVAAMLQDARVENVTFNELVFIRLGLLVKAKYPTLLSIPLGYDDDGRLLTKPVKAIKLLRMYSSHSHQPEEDKKVGIVRWGLGLKECIDFFNQPYPIDMKPALVAILPQYREGFLADLQDLGAEFRHPLVTPTP